MTVHWWRSGPQFPACGDITSSYLYGSTAREYLQRFSTIPILYCAKCRDLASSDESNYRSDSDRYAELRKLVEAVQIDSKLGTAQSALDALLDWRHR